MNINVLDKYFGGLPKVQEQLRRALKIARYNKNLTIENLATLTRIPPDNIRAIEDGRQSVDQRVLETLCFPLELMPNSVLSVNLEGDLAIWQKHLVRSNQGFVASGGNEKANRAPRREPSKEECETHVVLLALAQMDSSVVRKIND